MAEMGLIVILVILAVLCGPIGLIIALLANKKANSLSQEMYGLNAELRRMRGKYIPAPQAEERIEIKPVEVIEEQKPIEIPIVEEVKKEEEMIQPLVSEEKEPEPVKMEQETPTFDIYRPVKEKKEFVEEQDGSIETKWESLEQRIGTKWVLIAGVITVIVAVGFFLKYAYDNALIGRLGRVVIAAVCGLIALTVGEVTRRRGYEIVAKGVTALGFAILYAAVFSAYRLYGLIGPMPTYGLAILITAAAMLYAVSLNEILMAFLSLLGGFLTPILVSKGENKPIELFSYLLILGVGSMMCAYYRKWRVISLLSFVGTFSYYIGWFEKFFRPTLSPSTDIVPAQMGVALTWIGIFFVVYLIQPILYNLAKKVKAYQEDSFLLLANAAITFYYLWTILFAKYRVELAMCSLGLCALHLGMMWVVIKRCREDLNLRLVLLLLGVFFLTIAVPLYLKMYAVSIAWAIEGVIVAVIGLRYRNVVTQILGGVAFLLSVGWLLYQLPMHTAAFTLIFNRAFGSWCAVAGAGFVCHIVYRRSKEFEENIRSHIVQIMYAASALVLLAAMTMEWHAYCQYNLRVNYEKYMPEGQMIIFAIMMMLFAGKQICPRGSLSESLGLVWLGGGTVCALIALSELHQNGFNAFLNIDFGILVIFIAAVILYHIKYRITSESEEDRQSLISQILYGVIGGLLFAVMAAEWYWNCKYNMTVGDHINHYVLRGLLVIISLISMLFIMPRICPRGYIPRMLGFVSLGIGVIFTAMALRNLHHGGFRLFLNTDFGLVILFIIAVIIYHIKYRLASQAEGDEDSLTSQILYGCVGILLFVTFAAEWYWYCKYNINVADDINHDVLRGWLMIISLTSMLFVVSVICPRGIIPRVLGIVSLGVGVIFMVMALGKLHHGGFSLFLNIDFGLIILFIAAVIVYHVKYRLSSETESDRNSLTSQILYGFIGVLLFIAFATEWYWHCKYNINILSSTNRYVAEGLVVIISAILMMFVVPQLCPPGKMGKILAAIVAAGGAIFTVVTFNGFHHGAFVIFANREFGIAILFVASLFSASWFLKRESVLNGYLKHFSYIFAIGALFVLWILLTEEIYYYWNWRNVTENLPNWLFLAHMYISVMWAIYAAILMVLGFVCRTKTLRYIALGMFALLLAKVFIMDMGKVKSVYRIAAFFATGVSLVGVSYLYQYLKKKGFFEAMAVERLAKNG